MKTNEVEKFLKNQNHLTIIVLYLCFSSSETKCLCYKVLKGLVS